MDILNNLDTERVEPMSHVFAVKNVFRPDEVEPSFDRSALLSGAPKRDEDAFVVPKTVE
jgi:aspartyl-tRNA(Asn)/glutamyl-tRNA(Gln) amidotransferase subunit C